MVHPVRASRSLPACHTLPRDVLIPRLPGLGQTWYDHRPGYWPRRIGMSLLWAIVLAILASIDAGLFGSIRSSSRTGFDVLAVIDALATLALLAWFAVRTVQHWNVAALPQRARHPVPRFGRGWTGQILSSLVQLGWILLVLICAIALLFFPGIFIAMFLMSLMPETPTERQARLWMAGQLRERGYLEPTR
jgi:hypothetical protein